MSRFLLHFSRDQRGASALEFVFAAPIVLLLIFGIIQISTLFYAKAGLDEAVEAGARYATIYPSPTDNQIIAKINASSFGLKSAQVVGPTVTHGTSNGVKYVDVAMSYSAPVDFVFFAGPSVTISRTRRAYQP